MKCMSSPEKRRTVTIKCAHLQHFSSQRICPLHLLASVSERPTNQHQTAAVLYLLSQHHGIVRPSNPLDKQTSRGDMGFEVYEPPSPRSLTYAPSKHTSTQSRQEYQNQSNPIHPQPNQHKSRRCPAPKASSTAATMSGLPPSPRSMPGHEVDVLTVLVWTPEPRHATPTHLAERNPLHAEAIAATAHHHQHQHPKSQARQPSTECTRPRPGLET